MEQKTPAGAAPGTYWYIAAREDGRVPARTVELVSVHGTGAHADYRFRVIDHAPTETYVRPTVSIKERSLRRLDWKQLPDRLATYVWSGEAVEEDWDDWDDWDGEPTDPSARAYEPPEVVYEKNTVNDLSVALSRLTNVLERLTDVLQPGESGPRPYDSGRPVGDPRDELRAELRGLRGLAAREYGSTSPPDEELGLLGARSPKERSNG